MKCRFTTGARKLHMKTWDVLEPEYRAFAVLVKNCTMTFHFEVIPHSGSAYLISRSSNG